MSTQFDITEVPEHMWPRHHAHGWRCCGSVGKCRVTGQQVEEKKATVGRYLVAVTALTTLIGTYLWAVV